MAYIDKIQVSGTEYEIQSKTEVITDSATTSVVANIEPNKFYVWSAGVSSLTITLAPADDNTRYNEYMFQFTTGATTPTVTFPNGIKWNAAPSIEANKTYQVSIVNNIALICANNEDNPS